MKKLLLNYHDALLFDDDEALFKPPNWLHDRCINLIYRYFEHDEFKDRPDLLFLDPAVVSCMIIQCTDQDELDELGQGLGLDSKSHVFIPINDSGEFFSGCTHWSLLVYNSSRRSFQHYDSRHHHNDEAANKTAAKFWAMLGEKGEYVLTTTPCPQQENGYDCGMYVLTITKYLAHRIVTQTSTSEEEGEGRLSTHISPDYILEQRRRMLQLMQRLIAQATTTTT